MENIFFSEESKCGNSDPFLSFILSIFNFKSKPNEHDAVRDLLIAHAALRRGMFDEAERRLTAFETARPKDADAASLRLTLDALVAR